MCLPCIKGDRRLYHLKVTCVPDAPLRSPVDEFIQLVRRRSTRHLHEPAAYRTPQCVTVVLRVLRDAIDSAASRCAKYAMPGFRRGNTTDFHCIGTHLHDRSLFLLFERIPGIKPEPYACSIYALTTPNPQIAAFPAGGVPPYSTPKGSVLRPD